MVERVPRGKLFTFLISFTRDSTVLGTTVGHLTRNIHCPIVIVKDFLAREKK